MKAGEYKDIRVQNDNQVARISLNRPEKLNAIRIETYRELIAALEEADAASDCHVIVLTGEGGHFTAGNDLEDLAGDRQEHLMTCVRNIFTTVSALKKPVIAVVEGVAVGIGTTILLHCDFVVASEKSKFRLPFVNLGVGPEGASSLLLSAAIGQKMAREVLLTGRFFSAEEAFAWGLVNKIAEPGKIGKAAQDYIAALLQLPLASLVATKALLRAAQPDVAPVIERELDFFGELLQSAETQGRIAALLKK